MDDCRKSNGWLLLSAAMLLLTGCIANEYSKQTGQASKARLHTTQIKAIREQNDLAYFAQPEFHEMVGGNNPVSYDCSEFYFHNQLADTNLMVTAIIGTLQAFGFSVNPPSTIFRLAEDKHPEAVRVTSKTNCEDFHFDFWTDYVEVDAHLASRLQTTLADLRANDDKYAYRLQIVGCFTSVRCVYEMSTNRNASIPPLGVTLRAKKTSDGSIVTFLECKNGQIRLSGRLQKRAAKGEFHTVNEYYNPKFALDCIWTGIRERVAIGRNAPDALEKIAE